MNCRYNGRNLDFAEVHDCFTIAEILATKQWVLTAKAQAIEEGLVEVGGKLPVNPSGGLG